MKQQPISAEKATELFHSASKSTLDKLGLKDLEVMFKYMSNMQDSVETASQADSAEIVKEFSQDDWVDHPLLSESIEALPTME